LLQLPVADAMAEKPAMRPTPENLKLLGLIVSVFTLMNAMIGSFVQAIFAETLLVSSVVAVVGTSISPVGTYFAKGAARGLAPKTALIVAVTANVCGLGMALFVESPLVLIWGFVSTTVAINFANKYIADFGASLGASDEEKGAWFMEIIGLPMIMFLAGCLIGPCIFSSLRAAQAVGFVVLSLAAASLCLLANPAGVQESVEPWRLSHFRSSSLPVLGTFMLLAVHNVCRDALLGPSATMRFQLDFWRWGQLQFLSGISGAVGMTMGKSVQQVSKVVVAVVLALSLALRMLELQASSMSAFMAVNFCAVIVKMLMVPMIWSLVSSSGQAEQAPVIAQAQAVTDGIIGFVVPVSMLVLAEVVHFNSCAALYYASGGLLILGVLLFPRQSAVADTREKSE